MGGVPGGVALIIVGVVIFALRGFSGRFGARTQNAAFNTDKIKPAWIEGWNFVLGIGLVIAGVVTIAVSA
jgi:drug/metabolite transporter (DMT)-like permease